MAEIAARNIFWLPMATLWWRELVRFSRQRSRVIGLIATPLLFWLFIGSGLGNSFRPPSAAADSGYLQYFFPGTVVMVLLFTSVLSTMSVIEDRHEGFLLSVLVAPIPRSSLVLGKVLGGATQAALSGFLFLLLGPTVGFHLHPWQLLEMGGVLFLIGFCLSSLGFFIAWKVDSMSGFHAILNLILFPMWLLSGALFPASGASMWVQWVMSLNPLTYGVAALRRLLYEGTTTVGADVAPMMFSLEMTFLFCLLAVAAALLWSGRPTAKSPV